MPVRPPTRSAKPVAGRNPARRGLRIRFGLPRRRWVRVLALVAGIPAVLGIFAAIYFWISYSHMIDARFGGEQRPIPRLFARPFELQPGRALDATRLIQRLNDIGYAERPKATQPGEFSVSTGSVQLVTRPHGKTAARSIKVDFTTGPSPIIRRLTDAANKPVAKVTFEAPLLTALAPGEKRRFVPLGSIPPHVRQAVLAIEDQRFYDHPGVDPIRAIGALVSNIRGNKKYLEGASTITQQIIKNTFLTPDQTYRRKIQEQFMALVLDSRFTKDQIFELYLNEVVLGQRGPFAIHGFAEGSRIFFGKDVTNVTLAEAATLAGLIQQPSALNPFRNPDRAKVRRNVVLAEMAKAEFISAGDAEKASGEPVKVQSRALENEAPYFVDYVSKVVDEEFGGLASKGGATDVYTTLDLHLQRMAQEAVARGLVAIDKQLSKKKGRAQVALISVDPRNGEILALVGGRGYNETQYNRAMTSRRQPGSIFKPFVYLAAFEKMLEEGSSDITPATVMVDEPTVFKDGEKDYEPGNYKGEYGGPMTLRRALALSRNVVTIKVAEQTGYGRVAQLWRKVGVGTPAQPFPSIALGVFEASPLEIATAYTVFTNQGAVRELRPITRIVNNGKSTEVPLAPLRKIASPQATYLVTNMMRSVINEGTAAQVRSAGFALDAAGKTGTTNDQRDAWFAGFTPELLTIVWVGFDNNDPLGLSGSQAALPIWIEFTKAAMAARPNVSFSPPSGLSYVEIDRDTGGLATPDCPRVMTEAFLAGTEPKGYCPEHGGNAVGRALSGIGSWFKKIIRR